MQSELIHVDLLNKILYTYEHAQSYGLEDIEEKSLIDKAMSKKVFFVVEGMSMDPVTNEYLNGEHESLTDDFLQGHKNKESDEESSSDSEEEQDDIIEFNSVPVREYQIPYEPKMFPLYVNGRKTDFGLDNLKEIDQGTQSKSSVRRSMSEWLQFAQVHNYHQEMLNPSGMYLLDFENLAFIWIGKDVPKDITA